MTEFDPLLILRTQINCLVSEYQALGAVDNLSAIETLTNKCRQILDEPHNEEFKFSAILHTLETELSNLARHIKIPTLHRLFVRPKQDPHHLQNLEHLIKKETPEKSNYALLITTLINIIHTHKPALKAPENPLRVAISQIQLPDHAVFNNKIYLLIPPEKCVPYRKLANQLNEFGLSEMQIYRYFKHQDNFDLSHCKSPRSDQDILRIKKLVNELQVLHNQTITPAPKP